MSKLDPLWKNFLDPHMAVVKIRIDPTIWTLLIWESMQGRKLTAVVSNAV